MSDSSNAATGIDTILHESKLTGMQWVILSLCMLAFMIEGFDIVVIAYTSPAIISDWGISSQEMGVVLSAGILGMAVGAMLLSWLGDRYGRRIVTSATLLITGVATTGVIAAETTTQLVILRVIAGLALGVMVSTLPPLAGEYSPRRNRTLILSILLAGASLGAVAGGFIAAAVIQDYGWQSIFLYAGIITCVLGVLIYFVVPESLAFIINRKPKDALATINRTLHYIGQSPIEQLPVSTTETKQESASVAALLTPERKTTTLLSWSAFFCSFLAVYFLSSWMPKILMNTGFDEKQAIQATAIIPFGSIFGTLVVGWLGRWWPLSRLITITMMVGACCIFALGSLLGGEQEASFTVILGLLFLIGFVFFGGYANLYTVALTVYPAQIRSTGLGWSAGLGRFGAVISPVAAGVMIDWGVSVPSMFLYFSAPIVISAICVSLISMRELP